jgi:hypothetical protein
MDVFLGAKFNIFLSQKGAIQPFKSLLVWVEIINN